MQTTDEQLRGPERDKSVLQPAILPFLARLALVANCAWRLWRLHAGSLSLSLFADFSLASTQVVPPIVLAALSAAEPWRASGTTKTHGPGLYEPSRLVFYNCWKNRSKENDFFIRQTENVLISVNAWEVRPPLRSGLAWCRVYKRKEGLYRPLEEEQGNLRRHEET
eukprot:6204150-Pleurochrysis_carterae.AAC.3